MALLNSEFLKEYKNSLSSADEALVFYSPDAVAIKKLEPVKEKYIKEAFQKEGLKVFTDSESFQSELGELDLDNSVMLMMSSGNYGGLDMKYLKSLL